MPRWDKFFEGMASGIPTGYKMGLQYQEEQRAKADEERTAELHPGALLQQTANINSTEASTKGQTLLNTYNEGTLDERMKTPGLENEKLSVDIKGVRQDQGIKAWEHGQKVKETKSKENIGAAGAALAKELSGIEGGYDKTALQLVKDPTVRSLFIEPPQEMMNALNAFNAIANDPRSTPEEVQAAQVQWVELNKKAADMYLDGAAKGSAQLLQMDPKSPNYNAVRVATEATIEGVTAGIANKGYALDASIEPGSNLVTVKVLSLHSVRNGTPKVVATHTYTLEEAADGDMSNDLEDRYITSVSRTTGETGRTAATMAGEKELSVIEKNRSEAAKNNAAATGGITPTAIRADDAALMKTINDSGLMGETYRNLAQNKQEWLHNTNAYLNKNPMWTRYSPSQKAAILLKAAKRKGWTVGMSPEGSVYLLDTTTGKKYSPESVQ